MGIPTHRRHLPTLQGLRALACLLVVLYHAQQVQFGEAAIAAWPNLSAGVDIFFVLSGFVMALATKDMVPNRRTAMAFWRSRAARIVPLYWGLTLVKLATMRALPHAAAHTHPNAVNILASFAFIPARDAAGVVRPVLAVGWTLNFEFFFYTLIAVALAAGRAPARVVPPVLIGLGMAGFWREPTWPAIASLANGLMVEFAIGMAVFALWQRGTITRLPGAALLLLGFAAVLMLPLAGPWRGLVWGGAAGVMLAGALALDGRVRVPAMIVTLGDASYAIYLLHGFVMPVFGPVMGAVISVPAGVLLDRYIDRPVLRFIMRRTQAA